MSRNPYATAKPYTRWSIRRLSVGVASVVVASGFFILASNPTVHADQLSEPTSAVSVSPVETASALAENMKTEPTSTTENTSEVDQVASATSEVAVKEDGLNTVDQAPTVRVESSNKEGKLDESLPQAETVSIPVGEDRVAQPVPEKMEEIQTTPAQVQESVAENVKESTDVPASYLEKANVPGPFLAGVNQVIPYEAFGGDGMLTRLLLKASDKAPWSDNGVAKNPALLPLEKLGHGQYFYEVDLNGNTTGKDGQALLDQLRMNGTQAYMATVKVYGAKDGKADLTNLVASREVNVQLNGVTTPAQVKESVSDNLHASIDVPASYLEKANVPGPFLAGVNQVIPYEAFGGDGMLTRLLLKASDKAPWSDNGVAKNPALLPLEKLGNGQYFYEVDLNGNTAGKDGQALLDQLRMNGTQAYMATVKVYGAKDGKADLTNLVASREVNVQLNGVTTPAQVKQAVSDNLHASIDVPASYLEKANVPGPFLAGVNQVIPYEAFGGDGMLTRLLLKASDKAPWSDNGVAKNPALLPLEKLGHGQYFYEVDLNGNTTGKDGQALLDQLRMNGTQAYMATVKVYGAKDGKADLTNLVASREVVINFHGMTVSMGQNPMSNHMPMHDQHHMSDKHSDMTMMQSHQEQSQESPSMNMPTSMKADHPAEKGMMAQSEKMMAKMEKMTLPNTGEASSHLAGIGVVGLVVAGILSTLGIAKKDSKKQG